MLNKQTLNNSLLNNISGTDERKKYEVIYKPFGLEFINNLRTVYYKLKEENDPIVHYGLIAQEIDKLVKNMNYNFGGINNNNYKIGYTKLIPPKDVQELTIKNYLKKLKNYIIII